MNDFINYCNMPPQHEQTEYCGCEARTGQCVYDGLPKLPKNPVTTMAYVPFQTDCSEYDAEKALCRGTLFLNLDKPFFGGKCV